jgi:hypothetical protein
VVLQVRCKEFGLNFSGILRIKEGTLDPKNLIRIQLLDLLADDFDPLLSSTRAASRLADVNNVR